MTAVFLIQTTEIRKTVSTTRTEDIMVIHRDAWLLPESIFKARAKEADSKDFWDSDATEAKMFERDWVRACGKEKFSSMLARENKVTLTTDKVMMAELHDVLLHFLKRWYSAFVYYASGGSTDPYHMSLNAYTSFLDDCQIPDAESQFIRRSDCDTLFIVCNYQVSGRAGVPGGVSARAGSQVGGQFPMHFSVPGRLPRGK